LETINDSILGAPRHLFMKNSTPSGHPLHIAGTYETGIAQAVPVVNTPLNHICYRFDAAVGVHWEPPNRAFRRVIESKVIE
jgi:hypothetical protein